MTLLEHPRSRRRVTGAAGVVASTLALLLAITGCGSSANDHPAGEGDTVVAATPRPHNDSPSGTVVRVHLTDSSVTPSGTQVDARAGQPVTFLIDAASAGQIHVHSSPEQMIDYPKGSSAVTLTFDTPGVIDVESHTLDKLIVQLEVR